MKRAYGHEPILLNASPVTLARKTGESPKKKWRRKFTFALVLMAIVIAASAVAWVKLAQKSSPVLFPASVVRSNQFDLYAPTWLPAGWAVDRQSFDATAEVVTFTVSDTKGKRLVVTEQPKPPQSNLDTFYQQQLSGSKSLDVGAGKATIGQFEGSTLAGVATDQTWVLIRAVASVKQADFEHIIRGLKKVARP